MPVMKDHSSSTLTQQPPRLAEVAWVFLRLGLLGFGGPAAHIAMMHNEVVTHRRWLTDAEFMDMLGATNLIPGPNSTEMTIHLGYRRAGKAGLVVGGVCFILPAMLIVLGMAALYVKFGSLPQTGWVLYGVKPVIIAVIAQALYTLGSKVLNGWLMWVAAVTALVLYLLRFNELGLLFAIGLVVMLARNLRRLRSLPPAVFMAAPAGLLNPAWVSRMMSEAGDRLLSLFLIFLKIGSVLYGSGYVLLAFLNGDFVERLGWLTRQQLLDAIAVGQVTPGPLFTSATFIGYMLGGVPGAVLSTLGIFLPGFLFVLISNPFIPRLRASPWFGALLDGVNAASLGLMTGVTAQIGVDALVDPVTIVLAAAAAFVLFRYKINSIWLVLAGLAVGLLIKGIGF